MYFTRKRIFNFHCVPLQYTIYIARALDLCSALESATTIRVRVTTKRASAVKTTTPICMQTHQRSKFGWRETTAVVLATMEEGGRCRVPTSFNAAIHNFLAYATYCGVLNAQKRQNLINL